MKQQAACDTAVLLVSYYHSIILSYCDRLLGQEMCRNQGCMLRVLRGLSFANPRAVRELLAVREDLRIVPGGKSLHTYWKLLYVCLVQQP